MSSASNPNAPGGFATFTGVLDPDGRAFAVGMSAPARNGGSMTRLDAPTWGEGVELVGEQTLEADERRLRIRVTEQVGGQARFEPAE